MSQPARGLDEHVGPYKLLRAIGAGGSARIDLARIDRAYGFQRHVVIKRPLEHLRGDPNVAASLRREARIGGRLRHPNLVAVLDAGTVDAEAGAYDYLVLEYVHGTSLRELMQTETGGVVRAVPLAVALDIVIDIARGLHDAHELADDHGAPLGLVHRDVSPGNVLLALDGAVKVADFGIAKETRVATLSGSMHGTVTYMAPEQCRGHAFDRRADIWALGVILYELITRQRLFWADNDVASLHRVLSGQITRPRKIDPSLAAPLEAIALTALSQDPAARFATARELADALEAFAAQHGLVIGARWLARTVEEVVGARAAPWIPATTIVTPVVAPAASAALPAVAADAEPSLVELIAHDVEPEPELLPTFGPADGAAEEGTAPSLAGGRARPTRWLPYAIGGSLLGIGLGAAIALHGGGEPAPVRTPPPATPTAGAADPRPPVIAPAPAPVDDVPAEADDSAATEPEPPVATPAGPASPARHRGRGHHKHLTKEAAAGSNAVAAPTAADPPPPEPAAGSAAPHHVEWKPSMLLPTDSGSGTTKKP